MPICVGPDRKPRRRVFFATRLKLYHPDTEYYKVLLFQIFGLLHIVLSPLKLAANNLCGLINTKTNAKIYLFCRLKSCCV